MTINQEHCRRELKKNQLIPRKYYGQVFTTDERVINKLIDTIKSIYRPGTKVVEVGGGLGYITQNLFSEFEDIDVLEIDEKMVEILNKKVEQYRVKNKRKKLNIKIIQEDILDYIPEHKDYLLVGNIPFHVSGRLYRKFMSEIKHKPYGMIFITDRQYANTLMGQPPRCYRVSLQAQAYGDIEIVADVPPTSVYPEPKVTSCIMKISYHPTPLPKNFWPVVNHHFENFPTLEVESPKTLGLQDWIKLAKKANLPA